MTTQTRKIVKIDETRCDGCGLCVPACAEGAIRIEGGKARLSAENLCDGLGACLGHCPQDAITIEEPGDCPSMLTHWPVQLALVPVAGPMWRDADVLICADCVPFAFPEFHEKLLTGPDGRARSVAIACPKLDDIGPHVEKLAAIFAGNAIRSITVAHMEVPCCGGIVRAVHLALQQAGRTDLPINDVTVGIDGSLR